MYRFIIELQEDGSEEWRQVSTLPVFIEYTIEKISKPNGVKQQE